MRLSKSPMARGDLPSTGDAERHGWLIQGNYAHRGLHGGKTPENSLAGFQAAMDAGQGVECDVRYSKDGRAIVFHDEVLDRLTDHNGLMHERSTGELTQMRLLQSDQTIPTLLDLLRLVHGHKSGKTTLLIELKARENHSIIPLCRAVRNDLEGYLGPVAVMSYDPCVGQWFAKKSPDTARGLVVREQGARTLGAAIKRARNVRIARPHFIACDIQDQPSRFASKHQARGLHILTWTVRTKEQLATARACGAAPIWEGDVVAPDMMAQPVADDDGSDGRA